MFVVTLEVEPQAGTAQATEVGGAYAVCWINFPLQEGAEHLAKFYVEQGGWIPKKVETVVVVDEAYYDTAYEGEEKDELKRYFAQAEENGVCVAFYEWPIDAEDADEHDSDA